MKYKMIIRSLGAIALGCITLVIIGMMPADAKQWGFQNKLCNRLGTWYGENDQGATWMAVYNPGQFPDNGQLTIEWIEHDSTGGGLFPEAVRLTQAFGVWEKVIPGHFHEESRPHYRYTFIAHGLDQQGMLIYMARASGEMKLTDCNHVNNTYVLEFWLAGDDIYSDTPFLCITGTGTETRMPLVKASCR